LLRDSGDSEVFSETLKVFWRVLLVDVRLHQKSLCRLEASCRWDWPQAMSPMEEDIARFIIDV
jgi:hypothetical protein